jgi:hypothetical protein
MGLNIHFKELVNFLGTVELEFEVLKDPSKIFVMVEAHQGMPNCGIHIPEMGINMINSVSFSVSEGLRYPEREVPELKLSKGGGFVIACVDHSLVDPNFVEKRVEENIEFFEFGALLVIVIRWNPFGCGLNMVEKIPEVNMARDEGDKEDNDD